jgi:hypothetical protein
MKWGLFFSGLLILTFSALGVDAINFNRDIRPILANYCFECHGPDSKQRKAGLRLDDKSGSQKELKSGVQAVVPGDLEQSELIYRITTEDTDERMPPEDFSKQLSENQVKLLKAWVKQGGKYQKHWSFITPQITQLPKVKQTEWPRNGIDLFILKRLENEGLKLSPEADKATLLRRASFDLTGLPPSMAELDAFLADDTPDAYSKVVDRLLASPRYGEHMARYWLDAARYADTNGYQYDTHRDMWPWRDWVISAYNRNLSFDQFTIEQLAGDLLPNATLDQKIATGFNRNHPITIEGGVIDEEYRTEYVIDRVTTTAQVWMGLSFVCGRCHEHKYDPLSQKEFYQFFAFFNQVPEKGNSGFNPRIKVPPKGVEEAKNKFAVAEKELKAQEKSIATAQAKWEATLKPKTDRIGWAIIKPTAVTGGKGTIFTPLPDQSTLVGGKSPASETYTIKIKTKESGIAAIRLECLTHPSLPHNGPGRAFNSNFVLGEFETEITPASGEEKPQRIQFKRAVADYSQKNYSIATTIDGNKGTGWAVDGPTRKENRMALFIADKAFGFESGTELTIRLQFQFGSIHSIGRFRLSLTKDADPQLTSAESIPQIAGLPAAKRTPQQKQRLRSHFLKSAAPAELRLLQSKVDSLSVEVKRLQGQGVSTMIMQDLPSPRKTHLLYRGQYDKKREEVTAGTPAFLPSMPKEDPVNRLSLARWLVSEKHPLTARVAVNRQWQRLFGIGIVRTTEEFGAQGDWPSHPKLLDWLAVHFMENGWDMKDLLKLIVTSATYRQSSSASPELMARDLENLLIARGPRHRLDAEIVRDNALALSGLLVEKTGGPSVFPYHPKGLWMELNNRPNYSRTYKQDKGDNLYRRSLYTYWKRTVPPPSMATFDAPEREFCLVRRSRTNTPLQAFVMLHDPQFVEAARHLAQRMMGASNNLEERIKHGFRLATSRLPNQKEKAVLQQLFQERLDLYRNDTKAAQAVLSVGDSNQSSNLPEPEQAAWTTVARALLNLSETISKN